MLTNEQTVNSVFFIENGVVETYTTFEGNEFVLEQLYRGSVINHQAFFMQDCMYVDVRCQKDVKVLELTFDKLEDIKKRYAKHGFNKKVLSFHQKILRQEKKYPLDYIMQVPSTVSTLDDAQERRENRFKNVVMRIVIDIRDRKKKPKLSDFLKVYRTKKSEPTAKVEFQRKFLLLYAGEEAVESKEDKKFDKLMGYFDRCQKQLSQQQQAMSHLVKRVNNLIERREKKEKAIQDRATGGAEVKNRNILQPLNYSKFQQIAPQSKNAKKKDNDVSSDESESQTKARERLQREEETKRVESMYLNENEAGETENLELLNKIAGKHKKEQTYGTIRSHMLQYEQSDEASERLSSHNSNTDDRES